MSIPRELLRADDTRRLFEGRLLAALRTALGGETAIVIIPATPLRVPNPGKQAALNMLVRATPPDRAYSIRVSGNELHFEGTRGSVRLYSSDHVEYDAAHKRMRGYPAGIPTFLHPEVDQP